MFPVAYAYDENVVLTPEQEDVLMALAAFASLHNLSIVDVCQTANWLNKVPLSALMPMAIHQVVPEMPVEVAEPAPEAPAEEPAPEVAPEAAPVEEQPAE